MAYGYINDNDSSLINQEFGKFGLNQKAFITNFEYSDTAGKDNSPKEAILITIKIGEKEYKIRIFDVSENNKIYYKNELIDSSHVEFKNVINKERKQNSATIIHYIKSLGITDIQLQESFKNSVNSFKQWATILLSLLPNDYNKKPVDVFLQYQYTLREGQTQTYLELPRNLKDGKFICPAQNGIFKEIKNENGLSYINENNEIHPISKNSKFLENPKSYKQGEEMSSLKQNMSTNSKDVW